MTTVEIISAIGRGLVTTLTIALFTLALSAVFGSLIAILSISRFASVRVGTYVYIQVFRGIPLLAQLFVLYFGLTRIGIELGSIPAAVIGLSLGGAAIVAEIIRAGLTGVPAGQMEASLAIGMTRLKAIRLIIMPQAVPLVLAPLSDFFVTLIKVTAIASAVAAPEMTFQAKMVAQNTSQTIEAYLVLSVMYMIICLPMIYFLDGLEKKRNARRRR